MAQSDADHSEDPLETVAGPQSEAAVVPHEPPTAAPQPPILAADQRELLAVILNRIVPARDGLPGAGDLQVAGPIERTLAGAPGLRRLFFEGLIEIELTAARLAGRAFRDLEPARQDAVLRAVEQTRPAFFSALVEHTYRGYYVRPDVQAAIGFESRPPQPLGHQLPPFDPALLDQQRRRAPFWRRTEA